LIIFDRNRTYVEHDFWFIKIKNHREQRTTHNEVWVLLRTSLYFDMGRYIRNSYICS
jgi:hypothetical protein